LTAAAALQFGAVDLFVDRASLVNQSFHLNDDNAPVVAAICQRLDGIPLAIELAAARVKVLAVSDLAHRLNERFKLLSGGNRSALPRQKTLAALIDWSYDLLTPEERILFSRLAVFVGNFSLDAASDVCSGGAVAESDVFELTNSLADKSLLVVDTACEVCYRLLESTRDYALQKLRAGDLRRSYRTYCAPIQKREPRGTSPPCAQFNCGRGNAHASVLEIARVDQLTGPIPHERLAEQVPSQAAVVEDSAIVALCRSKSRVRLDGAEPRVQLAVLPGHTPRKLPLPLRVECACLRPRDRQGIQFARIVLERETNRRRKGSRLSG